MLTKKRYQHKLFEMFLAYEEQELKDLKKECMNNLGVTGKSCNASVMIPIIDTVLDAREIFKGETL